MTVPNGNVVVGNKTVGILQNNIVVTSSDGIDEDTTNVSVAGTVYNCQDFEYDGAPSYANVLTLKVEKGPSETIEVISNDTNNLSVIDIDQSNSLAIINIIRPATATTLTINVLDNGQIKHTFIVNTDEVTISISPTPAP